MNELEILEEQLKSIGKKIINEYKNCPYDFDKQQALYIKWFREIIMPLQEDEKCLQNKIYEYKLLNVKIGDGVTIGSWTDTYAYTVIARTPKTITIQRDNCKRIDHNGMSEDQEYEYSQNPNGETKIFRWSNKKHRWVNSCYFLTLGRYEYYDYSF